MEDLLLSFKQYQALLKRLDEINEDVTSIKLKTPPEVGYIDNNDLLKLLQVTNRTIQRWRKNGRLPYSKLGEKFYYRVDVILKNFKPHSAIPVKIEYPAPKVPDSETGDQPMACVRCPLFLILNS